jgi:excisionase family DNA binding protein
MIPSEVSRYALLEQIIRIRKMRLLPTYTTQDVAKLFGVSPRAVLDWISKGRLVARDLPGRGRFLPSDLESFLENSLKVPK